MTRRRYYDDSYTWRFEASVLEGASAGDRHDVVLDESFFYPTSGGQPHDTGTLGGANVLDVRVRESDHALIHTLDAPIGMGTATGSIDGVRRFDHMQQHTGQHMLSQAFLRTADAATIGFHLGVETVSIDLDAAALPDAAIADAVDVANSIVSSNVNVRAWFPSPAELSEIALRKVPDVDGAMRVVAIGDFDFSACGGTHVARAGEVGLLSVLRTERMKRGMRIEFLAGHRARADYARKHAIVQSLSAALTCAPAELTDGVARLSSTVVDLRRALAAYHERDLDEEATQLAATATRYGKLMVVRSAWPTRSLDEMKGLAHRLTAEPGIVVLFAAGGARTQLLFSRSSDVDVDLKPIFDEALKALGGGKGGGSRVYTGSAAAADEATVRAVLERVDPTGPPPELRSTKV